MSLAEALDAAADALGAQAEAIRPANGDPVKLLAALDPPAAARVLRWVLDHRPEEGGELADAWAEEPGGTQILLGLDEAALSKAGRKVLRRVLHRLRSRGMEVRQRAPEPKVASLPRIQDELSGGFVSPVDPGGTRLVYLLEPNPAGGARLFEAVIDDRVGVLDCQIYSSGRSKVRRFLRELTGRGRFAAVAAPPESVRALIARAVAAQATDRPLPQQFREWRSRLTDVPVETPTPGRLAREALEKDVTKADLEAALELVKQGRVGPWPPSQDALGSLAERLEEKMSSRLIVSGAARREQIDAVFGEFLEESYSESVAALQAHRFCEAAYVFWKRGEDEAARACLAAASAFGSTPVAENPVARAMLEVPLAPLLEKIDQEGEREQESSLLVRP